jgi:hypothetical protein
MENLFYHIGADLSKFPFMLYQIGTLKSVSVRGKKLEIVRNPAVNSAEIRYYYPIDDFNLSSFNLTFKVKQIEYVALLYSVCELLSNIKILSQENENLLSDSTLGINTLQFLRKEQKAVIAYESINYFKFIPYNWKWMNGIEGAFIDNLSRLKDTSIFSKNEIAHTFIDLGSYSIHFDSIKGQISSDESKYRTMLKFTGDLRRKAKDAPPSIKLFEYYLPEDLKPEKFFNEITLKRDDLISLMYLTYHLYEWNLALQNNNEILKITKEGIENCILEHTQNHAKYKNNIEEYIKYLEEEFTQQQNRLSEDYVRLRKNLEERHEQIKELQKNIYDLKETHKKELEEINTSQQYVVNDLKEEISRIEKEYVEKYNAEFLEIRKRNIENLNKARGEFEVERDKAYEQADLVKADYKQRLINLKTELEAEVKYWKDLGSSDSDYFYEEIKQLERENATLRVENSHLSLEIEQIRSEISNKIRV